MMRSLNFYKDKSKDNIETLQKTYSFVIEI